MPEGQEAPQGVTTRSNNAKQDTDHVSDDASQVQEKISRGLTERHPDWPQVKLKFYFSPHNTAKDVEGIKDHIQDSDIVLYENYSGNHLTPLFQEMADVDTEKFAPSYLGANIAAYTMSGFFPRDSYYEGLMRALYGSKKIVGHIDLRQDDPVSGQAIRGAMGKPYIDSRFDTTLNNLNENFRNYAQLQQQREQIMQQRFEEELERIITAHPELKKKGEITVLNSTGGEHTPLYYDFKDQGIETDRAFSAMPFIYDYETQAKRIFAFGKEPDRDILAKAYLNQIFNGALQATIKDGITDTDKQSRYIRDVTSRFNIEDIEKIHEMYIKGLQVDAIDELLRQKDLDPLPRTEEELQGILSKKKEAEATRLADIRERFKQEQ